MKNSGRLLPTKPSSSLLMYSQSALSSLSVLTASAAVFHILNIGDQTVCSCSIQCFYADSQYTGCFLPCNQFIHRLLRLPFGICPVFFSLPVPECNSQAESLQLHQSHASAPYLPAQDSESRISCRKCRAVLPIP